MRVLFDHSVPAPLARYLHGHTVDTAAELGWNELENGPLLNAADARGYEVFVTADKNLRHQQNMSSRSFGIVELPTNNWGDLQAITGDVLRAVNNAGPGEIWHP